jgi:hypothetical protein
MTLPPRTNATELSSDELLLFDFMFASAAPSRMMRAESYPQHMNVDYTHGLADDELPDVLRHLIDRGLCRAAPEFQHHFGLTEAGGLLWEHERLPDWDLYVRDSAAFLEDNVDLLSILSPNRSTAETFLAAAIECGIWIPLDETFQEGRPDHELIPWKTFPRVWCLQVRVPSEPPLRSDWAAMERRRQWWRSVGDMSGLCKPDAG